MQEELWLLCFSNFEGVAPPPSEVTSMQHGPSLGVICRNVRLVDLRPLHDVDIPAKENGHVEQ